jgi:hypothetical protein
MQNLHDLKQENYKKKKKKEENMQLKAYIFKNGLKYNFLAAKLDISDRSFYTIVKTNKCRKTIALAIENITKGQVTLKDLGH